MLYILLHRQIFSRWNAEDAMCEALHEKNGGILVPLAARPTHLQLWETPHECHYVSHSILLFTCKKLGMERLKKRVTSVTFRGDKAAGPGIREAS
jgi:hypothetical protein